jgi:hypothetical protein
MGHNKWSLWKPRFSLGRSAAVSKTSLGLPPLSNVSTTWGICFSLKGNPRRFNERGFVTVLARTHRAHQDRRFRSQNACRAYDRLARIRRIPTYVSMACCRLRARGSRVRVGGHRAKILGISRYCLDRQASTKGHCVNIGWCGIRTTLRWYSAARENQTASIDRADF